MMAANCRASRVQSDVPGRVWWRGGKEVSSGVSGGAGWRDSPPGAMSEYPTKSQHHRPVSEVRRHGKGPCEWHGGG